MTATFIPPALPKAAMPPVAVEVAPNVLVLAPDATKGAGLAGYLADQGLNVVQADDVGDLRSSAGMGHDANPDVVLVVTARPERRLTEFVRAERAAGSSAAYILMSDVDDVLERVLALEMGFDDLIAETCAPREVLARIHRLVRGKRAAEHAGSMRFSSPDARSSGEWVLNERTRTLTAPTGVSCSLTAQNIDLLNMLLDRADQGLDPYIEATEGSTSLLRTAISRLRARVAGAGTAWADFPIRSVRGVGYVLAEDIRRVGRAHQ